MTDRDALQIELAPETTRFIELCARGYDPADAAELAGFPRADARRMIRHPAIRAALDAEIRAVTKSNLLPLAVRAAVRTLQDPTTPATVVAMLAAKIMGQAGVYDEPAPATESPRGALQSVDVEALTPQELTETKRKINALLTDFSLEKIT